MNKFTEWYRNNLEVITTANQHKQKINGSLIILEKDLTRKKKMHVCKNPIQKLSWLHSKAHEYIIFHFSKSEIWIYWNWVKK